MEVVHGLGLNFGPPTVHVVGIGTVDELSDCRILKFRLVFLDRSWQRLVLAVIIEFE